MPDYTTVTLSYDDKTSSGYAFTGHQVAIHQDGSEGPTAGDHWTPYGGAEIMVSDAKPTGWTHYVHDLTADLAAYKGTTVFIGLATHNSWDHPYHPENWFDDVHLVAE